MDVACPKWEEFIRDYLLQHQVLDGASLITLQGVEVYSHGSMENMEQSNWQQFLKVFRSATAKHDESVCRQGFVLQRDSQEIKYNIYRKTYCSIYATSDNNTGGLIACSLPLGILICTFGQGQAIGTVVKVVEDFCDMLRA